MISFKEHLQWPWKIPVLIFSTFSQQIPENRYDVKSGINIGQSQWLHLTRFCHILYSNRRGESGMNTEISTTVRAHGHKMIIGRMRMALGGRINA